MPIYDTTAGIGARFRTYTWTHGRTVEGQADVKVEIVNQDLDVFLIFDSITFTPTVHRCSSNCALLVRSV